MYKKYTFQYPTGTDALIAALKIYNSTHVIIPSYTCQDLVTACQVLDIRFSIVDCDDNLQISPNAIKSITSFDTIIVPHMFGIQAPISYIRSMFPDVIIIEDCSQGHGLPNIGDYSDIVITSINRGKWLTGEHKGLVYTDQLLANNHDVTDSEYINELHNSIVTKVKARKEKAREIINAGVQLIGSDRPNVYLRGMYKTKHQRRLPYIPLHDIYTEFKCPNVDKFKNNIDWISIHI